MSETDFLRLIEQYLRETRNVDETLSMIQTRVQEKESARTLGAKGQKVLRERVGEERYRQMKRTAAEFRWKKENPWKEWTPS